MSDVIVIGGGHNGLVAAWKLAQAGASVTVVERSDEVGGMCRPIEFAPGYFAPGVLHDTSLDPRELGLTGLDTTETSVWVKDTEGFRELQPGLAGVDAASGWRAFIDRVRPFARAALAAPPPPILPSTGGDFWKLGRTGLGLRRLGVADMTELMRIPPMCAADWVNEHFEDDPILAEWVSSAGVLHGHAGPWSAGTAANLLLAEMLRAPAIKGGPPAIVNRLRAACEQANVVLRTGIAATQIRIEDGRATGVELAGGEFLSGSVLAACDPRTAVLDLIAPMHLPAKVEKQFLSIRARGTTAKLMLALDGPLDAEGAGDAERLYLGGGSLDGLERAFDAIKYGEMSAAPVLDVSVPTVSDTGLAPDGHHVVSILASFVPYDLRAGWTDEARADLEARIVTRLTEAAPTLRDRIVASTLWTPTDIEREIGVSGGCLQHVEHALDQLFFMRPTPSSARYETPIAGLFLGGAGSHPCGGITGLPGLLAAETIQRRL